MASLLGLLVQLMRQSTSINIKVDTNMADVKLPLQIGIVDEQKVFTDRLFTREWIEKNTTAEQLGEMFWICCEFFVEEFISKAKRIYGEHVQFWIEGKQGGWLASSFTKEEVLESWAVQEMNKWRELEAYCHHAKEKFWERFITELYKNCFNLRVERQKEDNKRFPEWFEVVDSNGNEGWALGPFDEQIEVDAPEAIIKEVRDLFIYQPNKEETNEKPA